MKWKVIWVTLRECKGVWKKISALAIRCYENKTLSMFSSPKDCLSFHQNPNVVSCLTCPGFHEKYIGKTDCYLVICLNRQYTRKNQPMYQHFFKWD